MRSMCVCVCVCNCIYTLKSLNIYILKKTENRLVCADEGAAVRLVNNKLFFVLIYCFFFVLIYHHQNNLLRCIFWPSLNLECLSRSFGAIKIWELL